MSKRSSDPRPLHLTHAYRRPPEHAAQDSLAKIARMIRARATVLELGPATGYFTRYLTESLKCVVDCVEKSAAMAKESARFCRRMWVADLDRIELASRLAPGSYDYVVAADVLEHLRDPWRVLRSCRELLKPGGRLLLSVPNVGHAAIVAELLQGRFEYREEGLLDETHLRFFTRHSILGMLRETGFKVDRLETLQLMPEHTEIKRPLDGLPPKLLDHLLLHPDALVYQFIVKASPGRMPKRRWQAFSAPANPPALLFQCALYWAAAGEDFSEAERRSVWGRLGKRRQRLSFEIPSGRPIQRLRLDPSDREGLFHLYSLCVKRQGEPSDPIETLWRLSSAREIARGTQMKDVRFREMQGAAFLSTSNDPYLIWELPAAIAAERQARWWFEAEMDWPMSEDYLVFKEGQEREIRDLREKLGGLQQELSGAWEAVTRGEEECRGLRAEVAELRGEVSGALEAVKRGEEESRSLRAEAAELRQELSDVLEAVKKAEKENQRLLAEADHRSKEVAAVFNSWSWRLTQPLRSAWDFLERRGSREAPPLGFRGNLDLPMHSTCLGNGLLRVSGWSFSEGSPIVALTASCNGATYPLNHGVSRKDVQAAFPQTPQAEASGFGGFLRLQREGRMTVAVHAELEDGREVPPLFERRVRVSSPASDSSAGTAAARLHRGAKFLVLLARRMALCAWEGYWPRSWEDFRWRYRKFAGEFMAQERPLPMVLDGQRQYEAWLAKHRLTPEGLAALREETRRLAYRPTISVVVPVYDVAEAWLRGAIESVREQAYENWELCLVNDASPAPHARPVLDEYAALDARVRVVHLGENAGIAGASNHGLRLATGEFVGFLDHDDVLYPDALAEVVRQLDREPALDVLYSDEDKIEPDGRRSSPFFKPDWSPDLLLALNYTCHFSVYRRSLLEELGGFRAGFEGSQDYDLVLRVTERTRRIAHIPKILYGWRKVPASAAATVAAKPYAYRAGRAAIAQALARRGADAKIEMFAPGHHHVRYALHGNPKVSIVVPMRDRADLTRECVASIESKSTYKNIELLVIDNGSVEAASRRLLDELALRHRVVRYDRPFNYSAINNFGAAQATGDYLLFLNNDTEVETPDWLEAMLEHAQRREVAAVGAKLLYPNLRIQHAGVLLLGTELAVADHAFKHLPEDTDAWFALARVARNVSAVTAACMMVRRQIFEELGGFDERLRVAFNDVDLCLRMRQAGYVLVYTPLATLIHHESATRKALHPWEDERLVRERWREVLAAGDPYSNPNLSRTRLDFALDSDERAGAVPA